MANKNTKQVTEWRMRAGGAAETLKTGKKKFSAYFSKLDKVTDKWIYDWYDIISEVGIEVEVEKGDTVLVTGNFDFKDYTNKAGETKRSYTVWADDVSIEKKNINTVAKMHQHYDGTPKFDANQDDIQF